MDADSAASQAQRKIELQSPEDLSYLLTNVRNAAAARLNEAFPQVEGHDGEDELRNQIELMVNEYINKTFTMASDNLSINGLPVEIEPFLENNTSGLDTAYEPFDTRKRQRVADLISQEERLLEEVAGLKRSVPSGAAKEYAENLSESLRRDDEMLQQRGEKLSSAGGVGEVKLEDVGPFERQDALEAEFKNAVEALGSLKSNMSTVVAKMERARVAGEYVVTQGR